MATRNCVESVIKLCINSARHCETIPCRTIDGRHHNDQMQLLCVDVVDMHVHSEVMFQLAESIKLSKEINDRMNVLYSQLPQSAAKLFYVIII